jgi:hypothetical protein
VNLQARTQSDGCCWGRQISEEADLKLTTPAGEIWWIDVLTDYPTQRGADSYWQKTRRCELRDRKFHRLVEKVSVGTRAGLIGVSVGTKSYFGLEITTELMQALESPPKRNRRIYRIETHWPFGGKPAIALNLRLLQVEFHPFVELPQRTTVRRRLRADCEWNASGWR